MDDAMDYAVDYGQRHRLRRLRRMAVSRGLLLRRHQAGGFVLLDPLRRARVRSVDLDGVASLLAERPCERELAEPDAAVARSMLAQLVEVNRRRETERSAVG